MMNGENRRKLVAAIAGMNGSKFIGIEWEKDDGTPRRAVVNPRDFTGIKGDAAAPSAQRAVATRKRTNPDLWNVIDHSRPRGDDGKPKWISIRCRGLIRLRQGDLDIMVNLG